MQKEKCRNAPEPATLQTGGFVVYRSLSIGPRAGNEVLSLRGLFFRSGESTQSGKLNLSGHEHLPG
jgi:hypothetical protein